ncbi:MULTISPECIES: hypothetical protein [Bradyrhizobium]|uniref:hypothetical protein n=1 Tax=Bradyrhizobium TaxID=374 RepID=UPI001FEEF16C|nr:MULTISPECIES: hypothetical protein [Bradyrhizobium]
MNPKRSKSKDGGKMPMVHPNAAAIDVGATMHMAPSGQIAHRSQSTVSVPSRPICIGW